MLLQADDSVGKAIMLQALATGTYYKHLLQALARSVIIV